MSPVIWMRSVGRDARWMLLHLVSALSELRRRSKRLSPFLALDVNCKTSQDFACDAIVGEKSNNDTTILSYASQHGRISAYTSIRARERCRIKDRRASSWFWRGMSSAVSGVGGELCDRPLAIIVNHSIIFVETAIAANTRYPVSQVVALSIMLTGASRL
jgi:hypothetical protein